MKCCQYIDGLYFFDTCKNNTSSKTTEQVDIYPDKQSNNINLLSTVRSNESMYSKNDLKRQKWQDIFSNVWVGLQMNSLKRT